MSLAVVRVAGRHRRLSVVLPDAPDDFEKTSYAWRSLPFLTVALMVSSASVIVAQLWFEARNTIALPFLAYTLLFLIYQAVSLPVNFTGKGFDLSGGMSGKRGLASPLSIRRSIFTCPFAASRSRSCVIPGPGYSSCCILTKARRGIRT